MGRVKHLVGKPRRCDISYHVVPVVPKKNGKQGKVNSDERRTPSPAGIASRRHAKPRRCSLFPWHSHQPKAVVPPLLRLGTTSHLPAKVEPYNTGTWFALTHHFCLHLLGYHWSLFGTSSLIFSMKNAVATLRTKFDYLFAPFNIVKTKSIVRKIIIDTVCMWGAGIIWPHGVTILTL